MKFVILALSTLISASAFATSDSYQKFYYPYVNTGEGGYCMGTHLFLDRIGTNIEASINANVAAVKSAVTVGSLGSSNDKVQENINFLYAGPNVELYKQVSLTEKINNPNYVELELVLDFAWMKKYNPESYSKLVPLAYYAIAKSVAPLSYSPFGITIRIINSPLTEIGPVKLDEAQMLNDFFVDRLKLELQKSELLSLDAFCR